MRLVLVVLVALALLSSDAPVASADHRCDLMPVVDPVELAACLAGCATAHAMAAQLPDCRFTH